MEEENQFDFNFGPVWFIGPKEIQLQGK